MAASKKKREIYLLGPNNAARDCNIAILVVLFFLLVLALLFFLAVYMLGFLSIGDSTLSPEGDNIFMVDRFQVERFPGKHYFTIDIRTPCTYKEIAWVITDVCANLEKYMDFFVVERPCLGRWGYCPPLVSVECIPPYQVRNAPYAIHLKVRQEYVPSDSIFVSLYGRPDINVQKKALDWAISEKMWAELWFEFFHWPAKETVPHFRMTIELDVCEVPAIRQHHLWNYGYLIFVSAFMVLNMISFYYTEDFFIWPFLSDRATSWFPLWEYINSVPSDHFRPRTATVQPEFTLDQSTISPPSSSDISVGSSGTSPPSSSNISVSSSGTSPPSSSNVSVGSSGTSPPSSSNVSVGSSGTSPPSSSNVSVGSSGSSGGSDHV